jgi:hypothetical protein
MPKRAPINIRWHYQQA